ncbi:MAG: hypothetical protein LBR81_04695 [Prevotellaceae bacterium]|jgi:hypothetical protein|nr:hypothetical protein [Prevotellaceae bacterium]
MRLSLWRVKKGFVKPAMTRIKAQPVIARYEAIHSYADRLLRRTSSQ